MKSRDVLIGAFLGGLLVILIINHGKEKPSAAHHASASASARAGRHHASASPSARRSHHHPRKSATTHPSAHGAPTGLSPSPHVTRHVTAAGPPGSSGAGWLIGIGSIIAIVFSAAAVTITVRAGRAGTTTSHIG